MSRRVRVAILAGQLVVGGAERQLYLWLKNIDRERFEPIVLTLHPDHQDYWEKPIQELNIPVIPIPQERNRVARLAKIVKILRKQKPELIHGWHLFSSTYAGLAAKILGSKSIGNIRNAVNSYRDHRLESFITLAMVDGMVVNTRATSDFVKEKLFRRKLPVYTVQNAIINDFQDRTTARQRLAYIYGIPSEIPWIVSVGRMDPLKRFDLLLESIKPLIERQVQFHCWLIGDGPEKKKLGEYAMKIGVSNSVTFTGEIPQANQLFCAFDIFAFPSTDEGMPNVLMEAAAAGLPIIAWRYPFSEEILRDQTSALLVSPGHLEGFSSGLEQLIFDPGLRRQIGERAQYQILMDFSLERFVNSLTNVYEAILSNSHPNKPGLE